MKVVAQTKIRKLRIQFSWTIAGVAGLNIAVFASSLYYGIARQPTFGIWISGLLTGMLIASVVAFFAGLLADSIAMYIDKKLCLKHEWEYETYLFEKTEKEKGGWRNSYAKSIFSQDDT